MAFPHPVDVRWPTKLRTSTLLKNDIKKSRFHGIKWWRVSGSNRRPLACHASALANWANPPFYFLFLYRTGNLTASLQDTLANRASPLLRIANIEDFDKAAIPIKRTFFVPGCCILYLQLTTKLRYGYLAAICRIFVFKEAGSKRSQKPMDEIYARYKPYQHPDVLVCTDFYFSEDTIF